MINRHKQVGMWSSYVCTVPPYACGYACVLLFVWMGKTAGWMVYWVVLRVANRTNTRSHVSMSLYL